MPANAWEKEGTTPAVVTRDWIRALTDPERMTPTNVKPYDRKGAEAVRAQRIRHLEKYGGTPFGEIVHRNPVVTYRRRDIPKLEKLSPGRLGRTPSESAPDDATTPGPTRRPPGGSTGGGGAGGGSVTGR